MEIQNSSLEEKKLEVAIVISDINEVKKISEVFRKVGVVPSFYDDLKTFWYDTLDNMPSLSVIDVSLMSDGELALKNHPLVRAEKLPIVFYYSKQSKPLLFSSFEIFNFGLIEQEKQYEGQVKSILKRYNRYSEIEHEKHHLKVENKKLENNINKIVEATGKFREKEFYQKNLDSIIGEFEQVKYSKEDMLETCLSVFGNMEEIVELAYLELGFNGQKLFSPDSVDFKYKKIPTLWLGQTSKKGIEPFAQNMANQVCLELMGTNLMSLMVKGRNELPDRILCLKVADEQFLDGLDWGALELYLSGLNLFFESKNSPSTSAGNTFLNPWDFMSVLDKYFYGNIQNFDKNKISEDVYLINLNFNKLIEVIRNETNNRFYWNNFFNEFINRFRSKHADLDFKVICMGVNHLGFVINREQGNDLFVALKSYVHRYPFWRHFEDVDLALSKSVKPDIRMIPLAPEAYLRYIDGSRESFKIIQEQEQPNELKIGAAINKSPDNIDSIQQ